MTDALDTLTTDSDTLTACEADASASMTEIAAIASLAKRAAAIAQGQGLRYDVLTASIDLEAVHTICGLKLDAMMRASDAEIAHDVLGIVAHLDRSEPWPGRISGGFIPRFANV